MSQGEVQWMQVPESSSDMWCKLEEGDHRVHILSAVQTVFKTDYDRCWQHGLEAT